MHIIDPAVVTANKVIGNMAKFWYFPCFIKGIRLKLKFI